MVLPSDNYLRYDFNILLQCVGHDKDPICAKKTFSKNWRLGGFDTKRLNYSPSDTIVHS